ncbi:MAG: molybdopterin converting factor subunit 1 [Bacteroidota bacterium]
MITVQVKLFASAREIAGTELLTLSLPDGSRASVVIDSLIEKKSEFSAWKKYLRLAVNRQYVLNDHPLKNNDEVAVIPPVSGG